MNDDANIQQIDVTYFTGLLDKHGRSMTQSHDDFKAPFRNPDILNVSLAQYRNAPKDLKNQYKSGAGSVLTGLCLDGRRGNKYTINRSVLALDIDEAQVLVWLVFQAHFKFAAFLHSTLSHTEQAPRFRLFVFLDRPVNAEEYEAIGRFILSKLDLHKIDRTTFEFSRVMFLPRRLKGAPYIYEEQGGDPMPVDDFLKTSYQNWQDISEWFYWESERKEFTGLIRKKNQEDPLSKDNPIGIFCRTYTITAAIEKFLSEFYEACDIQDRWTYKKGSTFGGLVVYDDKFAYSNHSTDPINGKLCNAFDLVRIHLFGPLYE